MFTFYIRELELLTAFDLQNGGGNQNRNYGIHHNLRVGSGRLIPMGGLEITE